MPDYFRLGQYWTRTPLTGHGRGSLRYSKHPAARLRPDAHHCQGQSCGRTSVPALCGTAGSYRLQSTAALFEGLLYS
ncbi:hypothetical protein AMEX_G5287 [Astyanax mexicanus]|uniref:Uncharacterized protein n=1 Tax=Astyanax mexicanus TaxID=7994 RepID=A0A8T2M816_ASTMX|nr:hypothetical protein AMEX_G5287 [Astyanax mexicanus]